MSDTIQKPELPKRFYKEVAVEETEAGFEIRLDGRGVRTPARALLAVRKREAAEAIAAEWQAQGTHIDPATMPVTRLVNTVLDGVSQNLDLTRQDLGRYAETDLLAYRADGPDRLVARQREIWDPVLRWAEERFGIKVAVASGVMHVAQSPEMLDALRAWLRSEADPFRLAAIHQITTLTGSLLLALAVSEGHLGEAEAWHAAHVDEDWNIELWGDDEEAKARRTSRFEDMRAAALLLRS
ncbi:ATP12 family protein [Aureimonas sp. ME7]|uniref:ATP12 family chaperone protein n=1 Tax=Aureimonas sp. ME7 TaxID=2744252 RepID=UPI0015F48E1A|nr:ATP12 family protein [Aureimonas sp. ME7]